MCPQRKGVLNSLLIQNSAFTPNPVWRSENAKAIETIVSIALPPTLFMIPLGNPQPAVCCVEVQVAVLDRKANSITVGEIHKSCEKSSFTVISSIFIKRSDKSSSFSFDRLLLGAYFFGQDATSEKWMTSFSAPQGLLLLSSSSQKI